MSEDPTVGEHAAFCDGLDVAQDLIDQGFPAVDVGRGLLIAAIVTLWEALPNTEVAKRLYEFADGYAVRTDRPTDHSQ